MSLSKFSHCIFKIAIKKNERKNYKFLRLRGLSTESFLAIWLFQCKFLIKKFRAKKCVFFINFCFLKFGLTLCIASFVKLCSFNLIGSIKGGQLKQTQLV